MEELKGLVAAEEEKLRLMKSDIKVGTAPCAEISVWVVPKRDCNRDSAFMPRCFSLWNRLSVWLFGIPPGGSFEHCRLQLRCRVPPARVGDILLLL